VRTFFPALSLALLATCSNVFEPSVPYARLSPVAPEYAVWWEQARACAERHGFSVTHRRFEHIEWFVVYAPQFYATDKWAVGAYQDTRIYVAQSHLYDPGIVRHEALHAITGVKEHVLQLFTLPGGPDVPSCQTHPAL
jgi:hypothetical protein